MISCVIVTILFKHYNELQLELRAQDNWWLNDVIHWTLVKRTVSRSRTSRA